MTSKNSRLSERKPILLKPHGKEYLWGGRRLRDEYSKETDGTPLAETWECSTHPDGPCFAASGVWKGKTLAEILTRHPDFLGAHAKGGGELPILIKLIDAAKDLSVQVHPDDAYAKAHENGQRGKSELWYVLHAEKGAKIFYGLRHEMSREDVRRSIAEGSIEKYLQKIPVKKNDVFYVPAGMIHAVGAGVVLAEVQENSNLTYRLYDYDRLDKNGQKRELKIEKALDVADLSGQDAPKQPLRVLRYRPGCAWERLCSSRFFAVDRMLLHTERSRTPVAYSADSTSYRALLCVEGCGTIRMEDGDAILFVRGDCIFVPAGSMPAGLHGKATFLDVRG